MRFLLRMAFWLTLVLALLPSGGSQPMPKVCTVGSQTAVVIGQRAQAGAKMLYEYISERFGAHEASPTENAATGKAVPLPPVRPSQQTLSPTDLAPAWRGPHQRKEARGDGPA
jgi:hypothetical protein